MSPTPIDLSAHGSVHATTWETTGSCPLVLQPAAACSASEWVAGNLDAVEAALHEHGAMLFRGFSEREQSGLERFTNTLRLELMHYVEGATPRKQLGDHVYTSTEFPPEHAIALHNELSYVLTWPMKIIFFCVTAPEHGGETPLADVRRVYARIPLDIRARFAAKGWMLVRNFGEGLGLTWQSAYRTTDRSALETYAKEARLTLEWRDEHRLRTRQVRPAIARHPATGDTVWFNHVAFWHASSLGSEFRELLVEEFGEDGLPYNTYYGDGSPIEDSVVEQLRAAYDAETVAFRWQQGDLLLADNMLVAHGRRPFAGPRRIIVSMGQPHTRDDFHAVV
ncbi:MAG: TauD/TfdA family dioxygenase [Vicinamibacterales bacterium]